MTSYFSKSKTAFYSLIFTAPLFLIYEIGILSVSMDDLPVLRNGADVFMRQIMESIGLLGLQGFGFMSLIAVAAILISRIRTNQSFTINAMTLVYMVFESIAWMTGLFIIFSLSELYLLTTTVKGLMHQVVLSLGAGIYEELLFRVLLINGIAAIFKFALSWKKPMQYVGAIFISALIFSLFHFIGSAGDSYSFRILLFRIIGGLYLGGVYVFRGYGIAAWTHSLYDIFVLFAMHLA
ncbi:MAG: CPBP family intramembrane metalloprotease [Candidatus Marinimicrobia bacterium]|nr:CPBP family intramembrane metalloprotease [Candidatus Neomarinimicrobiota bacterium]